MILQKLWRSYAPPWMLDGKNIGTFYESTGALLDSIAQRVLDGRLASVPWAGPGVGVDEPLTSTGQRIECQPDALPYHSLDRGITLYRTMGLLARRMNLAAWRQLHAQRGTHWGEIAHVRNYFADFAATPGGAYPTIRIVFQTNEATPGAVWYTVAPTGAKSIRYVTPSNWVWDGQAAKRTRWWMIIYLPPGFLTWFSTLVEAIWDMSGTWAGHQIWDGIPADVLADLWQMPEDWHSAHSRLSGLLVTVLQPGDIIPGQSVSPFDPGSASTTNSNQSTNLPIGNWGSPVWTAGGLVGLPSRPSWATFINIDNG